MPPAPDRDAARDLRGLELTELEGKTQGEAAESLGLSLSGMKSRVQRRRTKLKEVLLDCCHVELDRRGGVVGYEPRNRERCSCGSCGSNRDGITSLP